MLDFTIDGNEVLEAFKNDYGGRKNADDRLENCTPVHPRRARPTEVTLGDCSKQLIL